MEIIFLGTSSGWPFPRLGCDCNICTSEDPKDKRSRPSLLINDEILIDAPPDIYQSLVKHKVDPTKLTHILLTHAHDDHVMGLFDLSHIYNLPNKITLVAPLRVISEAKKKVGISMFSFRTKVVTPLEKVPLSNGALCTFVPVEHSVEAYAIKIKAPNVIFYAPEFRRIKPSSKKELGNSDIGIIDGSSKTSRGQAVGHETIEEGLRLGREISAKKIYFTNIGHKTDVHEKLVAFVKNQGGDKFKIAFDGLQLSL